jgi:exodeoxyribonuclease V gamma subunit
VPPLAFGAGELTESRRRVEGLHRALLHALGDVAHDPRPVPLDHPVELPTVGIRRLSGTVPGVCGHLVVSVTASRVRAKHHLQAWVRVAALTAVRPDVAWEAVTVGRDPDAGDKATPTVLRVRMVDHDAALEALDVLADLRDRALRDVVPVFAQTSHDTWTKGLNGAKGAWESRMGGDGQDCWVALAMGGQLDDLLALPLRADEPAPPGRGARLGWWAERVWGTLERTTVGTPLRATDDGEDAA